MYYIYEGGFSALLDYRNRGGSMKKFRFKIPTYKGKSDIRQIKQLYKKTPQQFNKLLKQASDKFGSEIKDLYSYTDFKKADSFSRAEQVIALQTILAEKNLESGLVKSANVIQNIEYTLKKEQEPFREKTYEKPLDFEIDNKKRGVERAKDFLYSNKITQDYYFKQQYLKAFEAIMDENDIEHIKVLKKLQKMTPAEIYKLQNSGKDFTDIAVWYKEFSVAGSATSLNLFTDNVLGINQYEEYWV